MHLRGRLDVVNETNYKIGIQFRIKCSEMKHKEAKRKYKIKKSIRSIWCLAKTFSIYEI